MNSIILIGRLCFDPELSYTTSQTALCKFTLAVDRPTKLGEEKTADFIRITTWASLAERCSKSLKKGHKCAVLGRLQINTYPNREGKKVESAEVNAHNVEFLERRERVNETEESLKALFPETTFNYVDDGCPF